jgi:hypothetical protein
LSLTLNPNFLKNLVCFEISVEIAFSPIQTSPVHSKKGKYFNSFFKKCLQKNIYSIYYNIIGGDNKAVAIIYSGLPRDEKKVQHQHKVGR